jgi:hypothetical protein
MEYDNNHFIIASRAYSLHLYPRSVFNILFFKKHSLLIEIPKIQGINEIS